MINLIVNSLIDAFVLSLKTFVIFFVLPAYFVVMVFIKGLEMTHGR